MLPERFLRLVIVKMDLVQTWSKMLNGYLIFRLEIVHSRMHLGFIRIGVRIEKVAEFFQKGRSMR